MWGFFKSKEDKIRDAFRKVKEDLSKFELKISALFYENNFIKKQVTQINEKFSELLSHYVNAVHSYNELHLKHSTESDNLRKQLEIISEEMQSLKRDLKEMSTKIIELVKFSYTLKHEFEEIRRNSVSKEELEKEINSILEKRNTQKNQFREIEKENIQISVAEQQLLEILSHLSNEYGQYIPVSTLLDELYKGDRKKASTLSTYLANLEKKGIIKRERKGRESYVYLNL
ncbi:MAG: BlaI/MecI/CopY family transcriptional regulator [Candidatus Woesearchaeota archaeon]